MEQVSLDDKRIITAQLGRAPRRLLGIERRCPYGYPQAVRVYPLIAGKPFPTLFWLTCPFLVREIDHLESTGWIRTLEEEISRDEALALSLREAHCAYIAERAKLLSEKDRALLEEKGMSEVLLAKGIGGTADFKRIKCLHLHVAHALVRENPIGERVLGVLQEHACPHEHVICSAF